MVDVAAGGAAFPVEGGPYEWVKMSFGRLAGSVTAILYWLSNPIWVGGTLAATTITTDNGGLASSMIRLPVTAARLAHRPTRANPSGPLQPRDIRARSGPRGAWRVFILPCTPAGRGPRLRQ